jgi:sirohydrochlorin cobaltochelatase
MHVSDSLSKTALILFSHGSVLCGADRIVEQHAARLRSSEWCAVEVGFLNYSTPAFEQAVARCVEAGAQQIVVVPYFLVAGRFVTQDLPPRIESARNAHPDVRIMVADAILDAELMRQIVLQAAQAAVPLGERAQLSVTEEQCELRTDCPLYGTAACPRSSIA